MLHEVSIPDFRSERGESYPEVVLSYEVAGPPLGSAPLVLVCHALTGNSTVTGDEGWWNKLISEEGAISPTHYTILSFNIPGNAYDGREADDPEAFELRDVARLFLLALEALGVKEVYAVIGASMGGALTWQIAYLAPTLAKHIFPIACDYRASDWLLTQTLIQKQILAHSSHPLEDARIHAMSCYRTPQSLNVRFAGQRDSRGTGSGQYDVESWLLYHGDALARRFKLSAYHVMTHLTSTIGVCEEVEALACIRSAIHLVSIDSDLLFTHDRAEATYEALRALGADVSLAVIHSIHGHDAFLMEYEQLNHIIRPYFPTHA